MKKEAEGSAEAPKTEVGGGWTTALCCVLRRLDEREGVYAYITDVAFRAHISLRPVLYFLSFSVLPCAFPRLPSRFSRSLLSSVPSPLSPSFFSLALRVSFILSPSCPPSPSFVASVVPRASPLLTLRAVFRGSVLLALPVSLLLCPRRAFRPRAGRADRAALAADWPPHGPTG